MTTIPEPAIEPIPEIRQTKHSYITEQKRRNRIAYIIIAFNQGLSSLSELAVSYYFKDELKIEPAHLSQIMSFTTIPWMIKPLFGFLSDVQPIFGYRRKLYIMLCGILNILCWLTLALHTINITGAMFLLFCINIGTAFSTVLGEAVVVELSNLDKLESDDDAKDYVSIFFFCKYLGALSSSYLKGLIVQYMTIRHVFLVTSLIPSLLIISGCILMERRVGSRYREEEAAVLEENAEHNTSNNSVVAKQLVSDFFGFLFQKSVLVPTAFIILFMATPSFGDPFFYFLTNELKLTPTNLGTISFFSNIMILIAIFSYKRYFKHVNFKTMIIIGTLVSFGFSFISLLLVLRINVKLGINDFILCLFSSSVLSMIGEFTMMPMLALACQMCPKNLEGTVYSLFMSALNFGGIMSGLFGSFFTSALGITSKNYANLHILILIANFCSLIPLPILYFIDGSYFEGNTKKDDEESNPLTGNEQHPEDEENIKDSTNKSRLSHTSRVSKGEEVRQNENSILNKPKLI